MSSGLPIIFETLSFSLFCFRIFLEKESFVSRKDLEEGIRKDEGGTVDIGGRKCTLVKAVVHCMTVTQP